MDNVKNAGRTAIARTAPSAPSRFILSQIGPIDALLDYGCGKGADLAGYANEVKFVAGYDPNHAPLEILESFDVVTCTYVLNTLPRLAERAAVLKGLFDFDNTVAFVTVRRDVTDGFTKKGTFQAQIDVSAECSKLDMRAESIKKTGSFEVYQVTQEKA